MHTLMTTPDGTTRTDLTERQVKGMTAMRFLRMCRKAKVTRGHLFLRCNYLLVTVAPCQGCKKLGYEVAWMEHDPRFGSPGNNAWCEKCVPPEDRGPTADF
jgi:hypothetical protein